MDRNPHRPDAWKGGEHGVGNSAGRGLDQTEAMRTERLARAIDHLVVGDSIDDLVRAGCSGEVDFQIEIDE